MNGNTDRKARVHLASMNSDHGNIVTNSKITFENIGSIGRDRYDPTKKVSCMSISQSGSSAQHVPSGGMSETSESIPGFETASQKREIEGSHFTIEHVFVRPRVEDFGKAKVVTRQSAVDNVDSKQGKQAVDKWDQRSILLYQLCNSRACGLVSEALKLEQLFTRSDITAIKSKPAQLLISSSLGCNEEDSINFRSSIVLILQRIDSYFKSLRARLNLAIIFYSPNQYGLPGQIIPTNQFLPGHQIRRRRALT
ncbi:hypothetical protein K435DRAFT_808977 [Dendrothele bispora CBS 962.96]|uniref:Uncharacterized protein n=1 Tax=Dendrothele bispora (strain CBS 962.96) TaxID=1314807 RepID=A0A4S8L0U7_DENBC|nr:hypothetical protein K435DRAFT_808977 [Dendrothele bispora CBS 962.96]